MQGIRIIFCFWVLTFGWATFSVAQTPQPAYKNYTTDNGLPSTETYSVFEDSKGYIWIASDRGVSRFDGYQFQNFTIEDGLPDNTIFDFVEDSKGRIWLKTFNGKMAYFDLNTNKFHTLTTFQFNSHLLQLAIDSNDRFAVKTTELYSFDLNENLDSINSSTIKLYKDSSREINPEYLYNQWKIFRNNLMNSEFFNGKINNVPVSIFGSRLFCMNEKGEITNLKFLHTYPSFSEPLDSSLKIYFQNNVIHYYKIPSLELERIDSTNHTTTCLIHDQQGNKWESTLENGVYFYPNPSCIIYNPNLIIDAIGNKNNDLYYADFNQNIYKNHQPYGLNTQSRVVEISTKDTNLLVFDHQIYFNKTPLKTENYSVMHAICIDQDTVWTANRIQISKYVISQNQMNFVRSYSSTKYRPSCMLKSGNILWIGTMNGLVQYDLASESVKYFEDTTREDSFLNIRVTDMSQSILNNGQFFLATRGAGLLIKTGDQIEQIDESKGLISNLTNVVYNDNDSIIWLGTNLGLSKIAISSYHPLRYTIRNYTIAEGLSSNNINDICIMNDSVFLATKKGVNSFPVGMAIDDKPPKMYLTNVRINRSDSIVKSFYDLTAQQNTIRFDFLALNFANPTQTTYRYRLEGADSSWFEQTATYVQFLNLPPNDYVFEIVAVNHNGIMSEPVKVTFHIAMPFLLRWYFISLYVLSTIIIIYFLVRYRLNLVRKKEQNKRRMIEMELKALRSQMNPHFTFNTLNSIQAYILKQNPEEAADYVARFSELMRMILENSSEEYIQLDRELQALERYLSIEQLRFDHKFKYEFKIDESIDTYYEKVPSMVLQPYIENAIWHGLMHKTEPGKITIEVKSKQNSLIFVVDDDGVGRIKAREWKKKSGTQRKSFGMLITGERLEILNQSGKKNMQVNIIDKYDEHGMASGTRVELHIPNSQ